MRISQFGRKLVVTKMGRSPGHTNISWNGQQNKKIQLMCDACRRKASEDNQETPPRRKICRLEVDVCHCLADPWGHGGGDGKDRTTKAKGDQSERLGTDRIRRAARLGTAACCSDWEELRSRSCSKIGTTLVQSSRLRSRSKGATKHKETKETD